MNFAIFIERSQKVIVNNAPAILTGTAMVGTVATAYFAARGAYRSATDNDHEDFTRGSKNIAPMTGKEKALANWAHYIPAVTVASGTVACIFFANRIDAKRAAALIAAYSLSERKYSDYKNKVTEKFGFEKEQEIREEIAKDKTKSDRVPMIFGDETLCFDSYSGRYFKSSVAQIHAAVNEINYNVIHDRYAKLGDFWDKIGLDATAFSEDLGWTQNSLLEVEISTMMTADDKPALMITYEVYPIRGYNHYMG